MRAILSLSNQQSQDSCEAAGSSTSIIGTLEVVETDFAKYLADESKKQPHKNRKAQSDEVPKKTAARTESSGKRSGSVFDDRDDDSQVHGPEGDVTSFNASWPR